LEYLLPIFLNAPQEFVQRNENMILLHLHFRTV